MTASLYGDILASGIPLDSHESDLYFLDTPESRAILARWPYQAKIALPFCVTAQDGSEEKWWDVPFAFLPWWEKRAVVASLRAGETARPVDVIEPGDLKD